MIFRKDLMVKECKKLDNKDGNNVIDIYSIKLVDDDGDFIRTLYYENLEVNEWYYCIFWVGDYKKGEKWEKAYRLKTVRKI